MVLLVGLEADRLGHRLHALRQGFAQAAGRRLHQTRDQTLFLPLHHGLAPSAVGKQGGLAWQCGDGKAGHGPVHGLSQAQLKEILTDYGQIGIIWFDGEWEDAWTHERGKDLYAWLRELSPKLIINNRVDKGRNGMAGMNTEDKFVGDYGTPEQEIPANGLPGADWESCMTMNDTGGFSAHDTNWKSTEVSLET